MELGITGHQTRGDEVIKILEMLGGKNCCYRLTGYNDKYFYYISYEYKYISNSYIGPDEIKGYEIFSLEDFLEKFPYKVGDKVNVWVSYDHFGGRRSDLEVAEIKSMRWNSGRCEIAYRLKDINGEFYKEDIKGKVNDDEEPQIDPTIDYGGKCNNGRMIEKSEMNMNDNNVDLTLKISTCYVLPDGYHFTDENGNVIDTTKILLVKNAPFYPKTYEECCEVLSIPSYYKLKYSTYEHNYHEYTTSKKLCLLQDNLNRLGKLLICRDAYWKIAGEEMELGKSWEPDYDSGVNKYGIICMNGVVQKSNPTTNWERHLNKVLDFPTEEMRDEFYENFKELIEQCKELL